MYWLQGGLEARTWEHALIIVGPIVVGSLLLCIFGRHLNVMLLGDDHARTSGISVGIIRVIILLLVSVTTGAAVSVIRKKSSL